MKSFTALSLLALASFTAAKDTFTIVVRAPDTPSIHNRPLTIGAPTSPSPSLTIGINTPGEAIRWSVHSTGPSEREIRAESGRRSNKFQAFLYGPLMGPLELVGAESPGQIPESHLEVLLYQSWYGVEKDGVLRILGGEANAKFWGGQKFYAVENGGNWTIINARIVRDGYIPIDLISKF